MVGGVTGKRERDLCRAVSSGDQSQSCRHVADGVMRGGEERTCNKGVPGEGHSPGGGDRTIVCSGFEEGTPGVGQDRIGEGDGHVSFGGVGNRGGRSSREGRVEEVDGQVDNVVGRVVVGGVAC